MAHRLYVALPLLAAICLLLSCQKPAAAPAEETYTPTGDSVGLDILRLGSPDGSPRWMVTYTNQDGNSTKFDVELNQSSGDSGAAAADSGKGSFTTEVGSNPIPLLDALQKALHAKRRPTSAVKVDKLAFTYVTLGDHLVRSADGNFHADTGGNWTRTKIFLANDRAEVYFNFNPAIHKAEFAMKDPGYGDLVIQELAKVF